MLVEESLDKGIWEFRGAKTVTRDLGEDPGRNRPGSPEGTVCTGCEHFDTPPLDVQSCSQTQRRQL